MRTVVLTACLFASAAIGARSPQSAPPPVAAVTIDVTVTDSRGRPLTGLTAADFTVELDGRAARILSATYLPAGPPMSGAVGPVFDAVTPAAPVYRTLVQPPADTAAGREFVVTVAVNRPGAQVRTLPGAIAAAGPARATRPASPDAAASRSTADRLRNAIATGRPERGLPIRFGRTLRRGADPAQVLLDVQVEIPAAAKPPLSTLLGVVDGSGAIRSAAQDIAVAAEGGAYRLDFSLPLTPGPYKLRFAAADANGTLGAIESAVSAELAMMGTLRVSDLLRWTAGADGRPRPLILDELPAGTSHLGVTLELYLPAGAPATADLLVKMALGRATPDGPAAIERIVTPEARDGALVAEAEFPLERLVTGTHALRAIVQSGTTVLGTATATVIKQDRRQEMARDADPKDIITAPGQQPAYPSSSNRLIRMNAAQRTCRQPGRGTAAVLLRSSRMRVNEHVVGLADARVTVVEYGDYESPPCARAYLVLQVALDELGDSVRFTFRNCPDRAAHPRAMAAAEAAESVAAHAGESAFWAMHAMLFENPDALEIDDLLAYADAAGANVADVASDLSTGSMRARVEDDIRRAIADGVSATPGFFVNGRRLEGDWSDADAFTAALEAAAREGALH